MITPDIKAKELYSNRYAGQETPDLPEALRRRLHLKISDDFRLFKYKSGSDRRSWGVRALMAGISAEKENGMRYLVKAYERLVGIRPPVGPSELASHWLETAIVTSEPTFCLDIVDILLNQWWGENETQAEVNELFDDHGAKFKVVNRRVEQADPPSPERPEEDRRNAGPEAKQFVPFRVRLNEPSDEPIIVGDLTITHSQWTDCDEFEVFRQCLLDQRLDVEIWRSEAKVWYPYPIRDWVGGAAAKATFDIRVVERATSSDVPKSHLVSDLAYHARVCEKRPYERIKRELYEAGHSFTSLPKLVNYRKRTLRNSDGLCAICGTAPPA
jgi:hypothetical protein